MSRRAWVVLTLIVAIGLSVYLFYRSRSNDGKGGAGKVRVAAILNLTGPAARFDAVKQKTLNLAMDRLKAAYPNLPMEMKILDAGGGPEATTVAVRQATDWGATYLLSGTSPTALAIAFQVRGRSPIIVQIANAANPDFGPPRPGEYRFWPDWRQEAQIVLNVIENEKINSILLIHSADPYSEALTRELREQTKLKAGFSVRDLQYDPAATPDFRPALLRAKQDNVQAIVIFGLPPGINALMSQMAEAQWDRGLIGGINVNLSVAGYDAARLTGPLWQVETESMLDEISDGTEAQSYRSAYRQLHNENPAFHSLYLADALYFIATAWNSTSDPNLPEAERIKRAKNFDGPSGHIEVNEDGTLRFIMKVRRVRGAPEATSAGSQVLPSPDSRNERPSGTPIKAKKAAR